MQMIMRKELPIWQSYEVQQKGVQLQTIEVIIKPLILHVHPLHVYQWPTSSFDASPASTYLYSLPHSVVKITRLLHCLLSAVAQSRAWRCWSIREVLVEAANEDYRTFGVTIRFRELLHCTSVILVQSNQKKISTFLPDELYVTLDHKISHKGKFFEIEIYT